MQRATAKKKAEVSNAPNMKGTWDLKVIEYPALATLDTIQITAQLPGHLSGVDHDRILGNIRTHPPQTTSYSLENGEVRQDLVSFNLTLDGIVYTFTGKIAATILGNMMEGTITPPPPLPRGEQEEGSWSAQAQG